MYVYSSVLGISCRSDTAAMAARLPLQPEMAARRATLLCVVLVLAGIAPAGSFGVSLVPRLVAPLLRCPPTAAERERRRVRQVRHALSPMMSADKESVPADGWTPKSGKKPLVVLVGFMGATPAVLVSGHAIYM